MISQKQYDSFLKSVIDHLESDWVLIGGSLLALLNVGTRTTSDIDLCALGELSNDLRLNLMKVADLSGLPIEAINPAADFFLKEIPNWKNSLRLYLTGKKGRLYRPSFELYLKLKLGRCSEADVSDCVTYLNWTQKNLEKIDTRLCSEIIDQKKTVFPNRQDLTALMNSVQNLNTKTN